MGKTFTFKKKTRVPTQTSGKTQLQSEKQMNSRQKGNVLKAGPDVTVTQTCSTNN